MRRDIQEVLVRVRVALKEGSIPDDRAINRSTILEALSPANLEEMLAMTSSEMVDAVIVDSRVLRQQEVKE